MSIKIPTTNENVQYDTYKQRIAEREVQNNAAVTKTAESKSATATQKVVSSTSGVNSESAKLDLSKKIFNPNMNDVNATRAADEDSNRMDERMESANQAIRMNAESAMQAQANQSSSSVLQLLA